MIAYRIRVPHGKGNSDAVETTKDEKLATLFLTKFQEQHASDIYDGEDSLEAPSMSVYVASDDETFTLNSREDVIGMIEANY